MEKLLTKDFLLVSFLSMLTGSYSIMMMTTVLMYGGQMGLSSPAASLLSSCFAFAALIARPFTGILADRFPLKALYLLGLAGFVLGPLAFVFTRSFALLLAVRVYQGVSMSLASTANAAMATRIIPKSRFTQGIGLYGIGMTLSSSVAPALGLWLVGAFGYRGMFLASSLGMLAGFLLALTLRAGAAEKPAQPLPRPSLRDFVNGLYEKTALFPSALLLLITFAQVAVIQLLPAFATARSEEMVSIFYVVASAATVAVRLAGGLLKRWLKDSQVLLLGLALYGAAMLGIQLTGLAGAALALAGIGYGLANGGVQMVLNAMAVVQAPRHRVGAANATYLAASDLSYGIAPLAWGIYCQAFGYTHIFFVAAGVVALTIALYGVQSVSQRHKQREEV